MSSAKILVVEDEVITAKDIAETLKSQGYDVPAIALSGEEAIQKAEAIRPDLVLMDIVLKGDVDGIAAARQIRDRFDIPVVYLTAYADSEIVKRARITEPFGYIIKPFEARELRTNIEMALYKHKAEKALRQAEQEKAVVLGSMSGIVVYQDLAHRIIWANRAADESVGLSAKELSGRHCYEIWQGCDKPCAGCPVVKARETGRLQIAEMVTHDGRIWSVRGYPVKDAKGAVTGVVEVTENITERKKAEKKLRESEARYRNLFERSPLGIGLATPDGRVVHINKTMEVITGYFKEELKKINIADIYENQQDRRKLLETIERYGCAVDFPARLKRKDGTLFDALLNVSRVRFGDRDFFQTICMDITERKKAQEALRETEEKYRITFESTGTATVIIENDTILSMVNSQFEKLSGYPREEIEGKKRWAEFTVKDDLERMKEYHRLRRTAPDAAPTNYEFGFIDRYGQVKHIFLVIAVIPGTKKSVASLLDITERKQAEEQIGRLAKFPAENPNPVLRISARGTVVYGNEASLPLLKFWQCRINGSVSGCWYEFVLDALSSGQSQRTEVKCDGQTFSLVFTPVTDANYVNVYGLDITERKRVEEKLLAYQKQLKSLASQMTLTEEQERRRIATELHDNITQSLAMSKLKLDLVSDSKPSSSADLAVVLNETSRNIEQIIQEVRTLTFDLSSPILYELGFEAAVAEWLTERIGKGHGIATEFEDDEQPKPLDDDTRTVLFRDVRELLTNVVKHAQAKKVKVSIRKDRSRIHVIVEDDGRGFDPEKVAATAAKNGVFGLFSIRERLKQLGGNIEIESGSGHGTRVTLLAPLKSKSLEEKRG